MTHTYAAYKRPTSEQKTYTDWKWRAGNKNIPSKWIGKRSWGSNTRIRQNRLQKKSHKKGPVRSPHNSQRKNPPRRHKHCKYICTQHRSTQIHKENLKKKKEENVGGISRMLLRARPRSAYIISFLVMLVRSQSCGLSLITREDGKCDLHQSQCHPEYNGVLFLRKRREWANNL